MKTIIMTVTLLLLVTSIYPILQHSLLGALEFGNIPLDWVFALPDGKYVSFMGPYSRVFSFDGTSIAIEETIPTTERYYTAITDEQGSFFVMTEYCTLDIYTYDTESGLCLRSSTDLSIPEMDMTLVSVERYQSVADGFYLYESGGYNYSGEDIGYNTIIDVHNPAVPVILQREQIDWSSRILGFCKINNRYYYTKSTGDLFVSDTPSLNPVSVQIDGLENYTVLYTKPIGNLIYAVASDETGQKRIIRIAVPEEGSPGFSVVASPQIVDQFELTDIIDDRIYLTGIRSSELWSVQSYTYSDSSAWTPLSSVPYYEGRYRLFPRENGFIATGYRQSLVLHSDLSVIDAFNQASQYLVQDIVMDRYLVLAEWWSPSLYSPARSRIYDLQEEEMLDFLGDALYDNSVQCYGEDKLGFRGQNYKIVQLGDDGIEQTWLIPEPYNLIDEHVKGNTVVFSGYVNSNWLASIYHLSPSGAQFCSETILPHSASMVCVYDDTHIILIQFSEQSEYLYFYRIEADYSLVPVANFQSVIGNLFVIDDKIIQNCDGGAVINISNPDEPFIESIISLPSNGGWGCSYDGSGHYSFRDLYQTYILDQEFNTIGSLWGIGIYFYDQGKYILPAYSGLFKYQIDSIVSANDPVQMTPSQPLEIRAYPNPVSFSGRGDILRIDLSFMKSPELQAGVEIYNLRGQQVARMEDLRIEASLEGPNDASERASAGTTWDGTDNSGRALAPGLYFIKAIVGQREAVTKMIVLD